MKMAQKILPFYIICFILFLRTILINIYIKYKFNISVKNLTNKLIIYNYKKNNKTIVIINGGGLFSDCCTDAIMVNNLLPKLINYNIVVIKYDLFTKYNKVIKDVIDNFKILLTYNFNIKVFIGNSIGATLILDLLNKFKQFTKEKLILISPVVNYNIKYNKNFNKDYIDYNYYYFIKNKYFDNKIQIDYKSLPNTLIILGTDEIFYYDIINFYKKCKENTEIYYIKNGGHSEYIIYGLCNMCKINNVTNKIINFINK